jgi:hypothetical protein
MNLLVAVAHDTIQSGQQSGSPSAMDAGIFMLIVLGIYLFLAFINAIMNKRLKVTSGACSDDTSYIPMLHIVCFFCHLKNLLTPNVRKTIKHNKQVAEKEAFEEKLKKKQDALRALDKSRTKNLTDI